MTKFENNAIINHTNNQIAQFGDFSEIDSYQDALNKIMLAEDMFNSLPAQARKHFDNDPLKFVQAAQDPSNDSLMVSLGLANEKLEQTQEQKQNQQNLKSPSTQQKNPQQQQQQQQPQQQQTPQKQEEQAPPSTNQNESN